jgi:hypothetical protein
MFNENIHRVCLQNTFYVYDHQRIRVYTRKELCRVCKMRGCVGVKTHSPCTRNLFMTSIYVFIYLCIELNTFCSVC